MPFPFIAPIKEELQKKLKKRETIGFNNHKLSPFVILSSGAIVTNQSDGVLNAIKTGNYGNAYKGCIITNHSSLNMMYQTSKTILGYDLDGKMITIDGEEGRKISTPIVQSVEIDTDGGNNTLKSANIKVKVFSLKQLEFFDLFFLRPSMPVLLEYGWNTDIISKTKIDSKLISKNSKNYDDYISKIYPFFTSFKESKINYISDLVATDFEYDYMVGKVTSFSYSPSEDGTYDITLEISAGNELQLWLPIKENKTGKTKAGQPLDTANPYQKWISKIAADLDMNELLNLKNGEKEWKNEFFNWEMLNSQDKDKTVSFNQYVSVKFLLHILEICQTFKSTDKLVYYYEDKAKTKPIIPMNSHKFMCSTSEDLIIPNQIPGFQLNTAAGKKNELILDEKNPQKCDVNGKIFNIDKSIKSVYDHHGIEHKLPTDGVYGNMLNIFIKYDAVINAYKNSFSQADFVNEILSIINNNTFGLCNIQISTQSDEPNKNSKSLTIIDYKLFTDEKPSESTYRFKIGPNSMLREFSFNMELSTLAQAQAMYQGQLNLDSVLKGEGFVSGSNSVLRDEQYTLFDLSYAKNSDGWFSVDEVGKKVTIEAAKKNVEKKKETNTEQSSPKSEDTDKKPEKLADIIKSKSVKFKSIINKKSTIKTYVFLDKGLIEKSIISNPKKVSALTYLDISFAIDGTSGFSCGEYFQIDGIPEIYNKNGYFQITNVKQGIDDNGWKTTIEAGYRIDVEKAIPEK